MSTPSTCNESSSVTLALRKERETTALGAALSRTVSHDAVVFLRGDLGSGKTTLARGWLRGLGITGAVKSPTYTLVEPYEVGERMVYHMDFYRLHHPMELEGIGIRDYFDTANLVLIEWPERGVGMTPAADLCIEMAATCRVHKATITAASTTIERLGMILQQLGMSFCS